MLGFFSRSRFSAEEVAKMKETLVADALNGTMRDVEELKRALTDSKNDVALLQAEVERLRKDSDRLPMSPFFVNTADHFQTNSTSLRAVVRGLLDHLGLTVEQAGITLKPKDGGKP